MVLKNFCKFKNWKDAVRQSFRGSRLLPLSHLSAIEEKFKDTDEYCHACADYYVHKHPEASWLSFTAHICKIVSEGLATSNMVMNRLSTVLKGLLPPQGKLVFMAESELSFN